MDTDTKIQELQKLEELYEFVKNLDIGSYNKEKIMKCIDFEIDLVIREVIMDLGKKKFQEIKEKK